ncbi:MAG: hypothetical protein F6J87_12435 [Spirulina sp. SIO3F2]|nr:hypothetical protein [Spirulina sp. SIO3F2]
MLKLLLKIILASASISLLLKYVGPLLPIPANTTSALILVLLPPSLMALVLWKQTQSEPSQ